MLLDGTSHIVEHIVEHDMKNKNQVPKRLLCKNGGIKHLRKHV